VINSELITAIAKAGEINDKAKLTILIETHNDPVVWGAIQRTVGAAKPIDAADALTQALEPTSPIRQWALRQKMFGC